MNKQQLANKIWASANKMRSNKIEVQDYKDYILGFIFYKYLSDTEVKKLREIGMDDESMKEKLVPSNKDLVKYCKRDFDFLWFLENQHVISDVSCRGTNEKQNYRKTFLLRFRNAKVLKFPEIHKSLSKKYNSHRKFNTSPLFWITTNSDRFTLRHRQIA